MPVKQKEIIELIEKLAPTYLAQEWDNVGLQVGDSNKEASKIMVCIDLTSEVVDEAVKKDVDMIITHHPLIFKPVKRIIASDPIGNMIMKLVKNNISLYCCHTNLDITSGGTNDYIGKILKLKDLRPLTVTYREKYYKLIVFVPEEKVDYLREVMGKEGAGHIGNYSHCTFQTFGIGTFKPLEGANPYIGNANKLERVKEYKLETIVSSKNLSKVIKAMLKAHPYEEVAYDIIPLENAINELGFGRIGTLASPTNLYELAKLLKEKLKAETIRIIGDTNRRVQRIAICTGSGFDFVKSALKNKCDCYITGDIKYHDAQYAVELDLPIIDAGHFETENIICDHLINYLKDELIRLDYDVEVINSTESKNPFKYI